MSDKLTTEPEGWAHDIDDIDYDCSLSNSGVDPDVQEVLRQQLAPPESDLDFLYRVRPEFDSKTIQDKFDALLEQTGYWPAHDPWRIVAKFGNFVIKKAGRPVTYKDALDAAERRSGKTEAATFGTARFGDQRSVVFGMNWKFMGGSVGEVVGEKLIAAIDLAKRSKLPLVSVYSTGGMRQQENTFGVAQMQRTLAPLLDYLDETDLPHVSVILGQVWGGSSASTVLQGDVVIGVAGSDFGFAGPRVIENYQKKAITPGNQSIESNYLNRYVDTIVDYNELAEYIGDYLRTSKRSKRTSAQDGSEAAAEIVRTLNIDTEGIAPALFKNQAAGSVPFPDMQPAVADDFADYERLIRDAGRPDTEYLMRSVFSEVTPLYNRYVRGTKVVYPPIIGALAKLDGQTFIVIGDQPSYDVIGGGGYVRKLGATPKPQDFRYVTRLMKVAARRKLPVVTFTDTLGAEPTMESETNGQSEAISNAMATLLRHRPPVISINIGALGSGGGLGTTRLDRLMALDDTQMYVAEPTSAASIVHGTNQPTRDQVIETLSGMDASAKKQHEEGFVRTLIPAGADPAATARNIREAIIKEYEFLTGMSERQRRQLGRRALRDIQRSVIEKNKI